MENTNIQQNPQNIPPENNMVWAILSTLFCCQITGIYAIVKAAEVESKWNAGDHAGAYKSAEEAKKWSLYGALGLVIILFIYLFIGFIIPFVIFILTALFPLLTNL